MRLQTTTTYPATRPALPALEPVRPAAGSHERSPDRRAPPPAERTAVVAAGGGLVFSGPAGGGAFGDLRVREAIQAYRALDDAESRRRLSELLGIDDYA